ncbi:MAG: exosortase U [Pirellulales bacterium]
MSTPQVIESKPKIAARSVSVTSAAKPSLSWGWLSAAAIAIVVAYAPLLWMFFHQQWQKPHYQFFPFVIGAFIWLFWQRYHQGVPRSDVTWASPWVDRLVLFVAALLLLFGVASHSPWCAIASLVLLVASIFLTVERSRSIVNLWGIWVLLLLLVPVPFNFDQRLTQFMQRVSSRLSSHVLDWFGTEHLMDGNTLSLVSKDLFVDEACSGIISMLSVVACAVIYGVYKNRSPLHVCLLAGAGVIWAAMFNVARISVIAIVFDRWGVDWSTGTSHEILGLVLFLFTFLALLSTDQLLLVCLAPLLPVWRAAAGRELGMGRWLAAAFDRLVLVGQPGVDVTHASAAASPRPAASRGFRFAPRTLMLMFLPAAILQAGLLVYVLQLKPLDLLAVERSIALTTQAMPESLGGLEKIDFEQHERSADSIFGKYSRVFSYRAEDGTVYLVSFDFPFPAEWHELTVCYASSGWQGLNRNVVPDPDPHPETGESWDFVEAEFTKPDGLHGVVVFSEFDQFGSKYRPQQDWLREQGTFWGDRNLYLSSKQLFQVQVWFTVAGEASEQQRQTARDLLLAARQQLRSLVIAPDAGENSADENPNKKSAASPETPSTS